MPNKKDAQVIDRNVAVNFAVKNQSDQQLKVRLQRHLDSGRFESKSELGKYFLLKGLDADSQQDPAEDNQNEHSSQEVLVLLRTIQEQLAELRNSEKNFEALVQQVSEVNQRTRTLRPAFADATAALLVELGDWEQDEAIDWAKENLLHSKGNSTTWEDRPEES